MAEVTSPAEQDRPEPPEPIEGDEPLALFAEWLKAAEAGEPEDANAVALATVDDSGLPNVRMVLLKSADERGFVFYTNVESAKGREILANPQAAMCFHWKSLRRQVRVRGVVEPVSPDEADAYYATRARTSRIGAWASRQTRPLESRFALEKSVARFAAKFLAGAIPRPPYWSGFRLIPSEIEFWRHGGFRLHERVQFCRHGQATAWTRQRLYP